MNYTHPIPRPTCPVRDHWGMALRQGDSGDRGLDRWDLAGRYGGIEGTGPEVGVVAAGATLFGTVSMVGM